MKLATQSRYLSVLLGLSSLSVLGQAVDDGNWDRAAGAAGFLSLLLALPVVAVFDATRKLLDAGYGHGKIIHAMRMDRDRQEQELGIPDRKRSRGATLALRVALSGGALFPVGVLSALIGPMLPEKVFILCMSGGAITGVIAGLAYMGLDWERHHLVGQRWRRFLESRWGGWWVKLAGLGLKCLPGDPLRTALAPPPVAELPRPTAVNLPGLPAVVQRSQACLRQGEAYLLGTSAERLFLGRGATPEEQEFERGLQENLEQIQAMLAELTGPNPTAPLIAAAQAVCDAVDGLIGGREWSL